MQKTFFLFLPYEKDGYIALYSKDGKIYLFYWWQDDILAVGDVDTADEQVKIFDEEAPINASVLRIHLGTARHVHDVEVPSIPPLSRYRETPYFRIVGGPYKDESVWSVETMSVVGRVVESPVLDLPT